MLVSEGSCDLLALDEAPNRTTMQRQAREFATLPFDE